MKAPAFSYSRPDTVEATCDILAEHGGDAKILAGGQSLMATLNLRLSAPALLVDINRIASLKGLSVTPDGVHLRIGALVRHVEVAESALVSDRVPLVSMAMTHVAHAAIRNRGTTCGSLAMADPSAEMPACAVTLEAILVLQSKKDGVRRVPASQFFFGLYETARRDDEVLVEVLFPCRQPDERFGFDELSRRHGDFAMVGVAATAHYAGGKISGLRLVVFGTDPMPILSVSAARIAEGQSWSVALGKQIAAEAVQELDPDDNMFGGPAVKRRQAAALICRVLAATFGESNQTHG